MLLQEEGKDVVPKSSCEREKLESHSVAAEGGDVRVLSVVGDHPSWRVEGGVSKAEVLFQAFDTS